MIAPLLTNDQTTAVLLDANHTPPVTFIGDPGALDIVFGFTWTKFLLDLHLRLWRNVWSCGTLYVSHFSNAAADGGGGWWNRHVL